jgi:hypothetical protein
MRPGLGAYICDDGSVPNGVNCADGTDAVFYSDTTGAAINTPILATTATSSFSLTTLLVIGVAIYFLMKGRA